MRHTSSAAVGTHSNDSGPTQKATTTGGGPQSAHCRGQQLAGKARTRVLSVREVGGTRRRATHASAAQDRVQVHLEVLRPKTSCRVCTTRMRLCGLHDAMTSTSMAERFARVPASMIGLREAGSDATTIVGKAGLISAPVPRATGTSSGEVWELRWIRGSESSLASERNTHGFLAEILISIPITLCRYRYRLDRPPKRP